MERFYNDKGSAFLEWKDDLPISLHIDHCPFVYGRGAQCDVEAAEMRLPVVGIFAFGVGVMDDHAAHHR
jgi:hypothetical protein